LLDDVEARGAGYVRRSLLLAAAVAAVVGATAWAFGVPGPVLVGVWVGSWTLVPGLGAIVALVPLAAVTALTATSGSRIHLVVVAATLVGAEWYRRRRIEPRRVRPGVAILLFAVAIGLGTAGFGGVLVAVVAAGLATATLTAEHPFPRLPRDLEAGDITVAAEAGSARRPAWPGELDGWRSVVTLVVVAVGGVLAWALLGRVGHAAVWLVVAGMIAIALDRPVAYLVRKGMARVAAVALVFLLGVAVIVGAGVAGVRGGASTTSRLSDELPGIVADMEDLPLLGGWLRDHDADVWVEDQLQDLPQRVERAQGVEDWLPTIGARLLDLFWIVALAIALVADGPRLRAATQRRVPAAKRRQFARIVEVSQRAVGGYLAGAALVAGINATVVFLIAVALGISLAPVLAVWAFIWNFVPQIGGFMGGFPLVVLALTIGPAQALIAGGLFIAYQFAENHVIQPSVIGEAIDVPPWATLLTALAGGAAAGVLGAVVFTPLVGVIRVVVLEIKRDDFPGKVVQSGEARPALEPLPS
jgi:predicted PurR-regulated permease PerM